MSIIEFMDEIDEDSMCYVFSKKKEAYRVSIRKKKVNQAFQENRQKYTNRSDIPIQNNINNNNIISIEEQQQQQSSQESPIPQQPQGYSAFNQNQILKHSQDFSDQEESIKNASAQLIEILNQFKEINTIDINAHKLDQLKDYIEYAVYLEQTTNKPIIELKDISFAIHFMSLNEISIQKKLFIIDVLSILYELKGIQQNIIQYFIQYLNTDSYYLIEKILDFFIQQLQSEQNSSIQLLLKLQKPFFIKIFMRLLTLKIDRISIRILNTIKILIENNTNNNESSNITFINSFLHSQNMIAQLLVSNFETKNNSILQNVSNIICLLLRKIKDSQACSNQMEQFIQTLIDSNFINKIFEIFNESSAEKQYFKPLICSIFAEANHFQIEHFFYSNLKYFIMNHLFNFLTQSNKEMIYLSLQFIHQLIFQENQFNSQGYYPKKKLIQSLDINAFINSYSKDPNINIRQEALLIQSYLS